MDFLKDEFLDQLQAQVDDNGNIIIESAEFTPQQILQEIDPTLFDELFQQWCENKRQERLEKAEEILNLYDNRERFSKLKELYKRGAIIPFVGAGMSIPSGYRGWTNFLEWLLKETKLEENDIREKLKNGKYEEVAQDIFDYMGASTFNEALENEYSKQSLISGAICFLPHIFPETSIITTNFDTVIERCYQEQKQKSFEIICGANAIQLPKYLGEAKQVLVMLHGKSFPIKDRVLTKSEYDHHYIENDTLIKCIGAITNKTLLFLGCSLSIDRTISIMQDIVNQNESSNLPRHYAFIKTNEGEDRLERKRILNTANIFPIWYEGDHDECIAALLEKLREGIDN